MGDGTDDPGRTALALARAAVERYVQTGLPAEPPPDLPSELRQAHGVFVTIRVRGELRGCVGTLAPSRPDVAREIIAAATAAATRDPRFPPVRPGELTDLSYEVDIVGALEAVRGLESLDPKVYGVLVEGSGHRGVLLPGLDGVKDAGHQVRLARAKAGIPETATVQLSRFVVRRFRDDG
ncbi:MAG TPA: AmmeMemoRadiSam system protein A [Methylomirabilota bacterium]|nr:AmmeMemoRadiSam system protein A [Methylomirabilota bacterium]